MATTKLMAMHVNRGRTAAQCLSYRIRYAINPDKTEEGSLISSFACDPHMADAEFLLAKREYQNITGRSRYNDVIAYQVRQSFKPGEITPEEANRVGYELAARFLKGRHAFIVATHTDRAHVHNHIIWNSTSLDCARKFRDFLGSGKAVRRLSDLICLEHNLSVVAAPIGRGKRYNKWQGNQVKPVQRNMLRMAIDAALDKRPATLEALLKQLEEEGWEVKHGKHISLRYHDQTRFKRLSSLGEEYSEAALRAVIAGDKVHLPQRGKVSPTEKHEDISLLLDIQAKLHQGKGPGYERWAKVFNLKQMANSMNYLSEHGVLSYDDLQSKLNDAVALHAELQAQVKEAERHLVEIAALKKNMINYVKTREVYIAYRQSGYSKKFFAEHAAEIQLHKASKKAFDELNVTKLPTIKALNAEYVEVLEKKKRAYGEYRKARTKMRELLTVKANVDRLLGDANHYKQRMSIE